MDIIDFVYLVGIIPTSLVVYAIAARWCVKEYGEIDTVDRLFGSFGAFALGCVWPFAAAVLLVYVSCRALCKATGIDFLALLEGRK